jgi:hypothetical protein
MKKTNTEVSIVGQDVPTVLDTIKEKLNSLKAITDTPYKTSGNLTGIGDIKTLKDIGSLIKSYASVKAKENAYNAAADDLGIKNYPLFSLDGGTAAQWKHDIDLRIQIITVEDKKNKYQKAYDTMQKFLSEEEQKAIVMKEMASLLED